ncbi:5-(carboxyamino)imidazole ribonucleotide synthase [Jatrophihabitans sp. YIM 134969]
MDPRTALPVVGMIGGGQLARMTHQAAIALGQSLRVLSVGPDESAALVTPDVVLGTHTDLDALMGFAAGCDVVTFDHEHVPGEHIEAMVAAGHKVYPGREALQYAQDKALMRRRLTDLGAPVPTWTEFTVSDPGVTLLEVEAFAAEVGWPFVLKATRGGYDGRGVWVVDDLDQAREVVDSGVPLMGEELVRLDREVAALVARSPFGQGAAYPVVETVQRDGICVEVIAPAPDLDPDLAAEAEHLALRIAGELGVVGLLAVELFVSGGRLLVNELAMRPHNSGHWTMDGARTSQFEQHLRAVLDYPLGATAPIAPWTVMANVIGAPGDVDVQPATVDERLHHLFAQWPDVKVHLYGKGWRPGRKVGHVNAIGTDLDDVRARARAAADYLARGNGIVGGPHG